MSYYRLFNIMTAVISCLTSTHRVKIVSLCLLIKNLDIQFKKFRFLL